MLTANLLIHPAGVGAAPTSAAGTSGASSADSGSGLPTGQSLNNMFLQLLVAQLQNQSPLDPVDPSQFVGQLAQFSELSEVTSIEQLLQQFAAGQSTTTGTAAGAPAGTATMSGAPPENVLHGSSPSAAPSVRSSAAAPFAQLAQQALAKIQGGR